MGVTRMDIKELYSNVLLISIANRRNFYHLVKRAEEETERYIANHKQNSLGLYEILPEGFSGLYFMESLARKAGSSLGEVYLLTQERKEEIILSLLKSIDPIEEAFCDYYDDSVEGQVEFKGVVRVLDLSDIVQIQQYYRTRGNGEASDNSFVIPYSVTFRRVLERTDEKGTLYYSLYFSAADGFSSRYVNDDFIVWTGKNGPIADFINGVIDTHEDAESKDSETVIPNSDPGIYPIIPFQNTISNDLRRLTERAYVKISGEKTTTRYLPVLVNKETNTLYILLQHYSDHYDELAKGNVMLCESISSEGQKIKIVLTQEKVTENKKGSIKQQNDSRWDESFSIALYKGAFNNPQGKEKRLAMIKTLKNAERYLLVYVDLKEHLIYFNENEIVESYKYFTWNAIELFYTFNSRDRRISIKPLPIEIRKDLAKKAEEREKPVVSTLPVSKRVLQSAKQSVKTTVKPKKKASKQTGPLCPVCHKPYSGGLYEDSFNAPGAKMCFNCYRKFRISMRDN